MAQPSETMLMLGYQYRKNGSREGWYEIWLVGPKDVLGQKIVKSAKAVADKRFGRTWVKSDCQLGTGPDAKWTTHTLVGMMGQEVDQGRPLFRSGSILNDKCRFQDLPARRRS